MVKKTGKTFEITCGELTPERKRAIAPREVVSIGKPLRLVIAIGGAWLFYYGTDFDAPAAMRAAATAFTVIGVAAILFAIFVHKFAEIRFFAKARKIGCFPESVSVGKGGMFVRRVDAASASAGRKASANASGGGNSSKATGGAFADSATAVSVNAERFYAYAEIGKIKEYEGHFKINLLYGEAPCLYIFKEDFEHGEPEAFVSFILSKQSAL